jgi:eukaryotic-like serine/threonine-protein kinase
VNGTAFVTMSLLVGETFSRRIAREGAVAATVVECVLRDCLAGLDYAHRLGVFHRDVKPENIFLTESPAGMVARLIDFGLAKPVRAIAGVTRSLTDSGELSGTPRYMAPELLLGQVSAPSAQGDLFALGVSLFRALEGNHPFPARNLAALVRGYRTPQLPVPGALRTQREHPALAAFVRVLIAVDPSLRPSDALSALSLYESYRLGTRLPGLV